MTSLLPVVLMCPGSAWFQNAAGLAYALTVFLIEAQVHGAHVQGLQAQAPFPQPQTPGVQLH